MRKPINVDYAPAESDQCLYYSLPICLFVYKNICCGYSLESPRQGNSNEYPQQGDSNEYPQLRTDKNYP